MKSLIVAVAILLSIALLSTIRLIPAQGTTVEFLFDRAFNYRMTKEVLAHGDVPLIDRLSIYPLGKNIRASLPIGMYHACAFFYKLLNAVRPTSLERFIVFFCAVAGALIFIPMYGISSLIYRNRIIAFLTAILAGIIPAYLHRTVCYWYRYEVLATPLLFMGLLFFIQALTVEEDRASNLYAVGSALFTGAAAFVWRMSVLFVLPYVLIGIYLLVKKRTSSKRQLRACMVVLVLSLVLICIASGITPKGGVPHYWLFTKASLRIVLHNMGFTQQFSGFDGLAYDTRELHSVAFLDLFSMKYLSYAGFLVIAYLVLQAVGTRRTVPKNIVSVYLAFFLVLTLLFLRMKIFLGPLAALCLGETLAFAFTTKDKGRILLIAAIITIVALTGYDSYKLITTRRANTKMKPYQRQVLNAIRTKTPRDAVILCHWPDGYVIQTYCNRATTTDSLLEHPEIVRRITELSTIYYSPDESRLLKFCREFGATHLLVPTNKKRAYARYAGFDYGAYYKKGKPAPGRTMTVLDRLVFTPKKSAHFKLLYQNKRYRLFSIPAEARKTPNSAKSPLS
jgi:hypothetical protein